MAINVRGRVVEREGPARAWRWGGECQVCDLRIPKAACGATALVCPHLVATSIIMTDTASTPPASPANDGERNRFSARAGRYARVGSGMGGIAAKMAANRLLGRELDTNANAAEIAAALGNLKGPI
ncbi:MAG: hypothetical protein AAGH82_03240, partial [Pseudomonadota bacterium]